MQWMFLIDLNLAMLLFKSVSFGDDQRLDNVDQTCTRRYTTSLRCSRLLWARTVTPVENMPDFAGRYRSNRLLCEFFDS